MKGAKSTHTTEHMALWLRFGGIENSGTDKKNPERKSTMFLMELQGGRAICLVSQVVSVPLHMSQEMSVWPGIEIFHHQGISDVPGQRPRVMSPSHCHLNSAQQSPDDLLLKVVQQRPRRWRPTSSIQTSIKDAHSSLE